MPSPATTRPRYCRRSPLRFRLWQKSAPPQSMRQSMLSCRPASEGFDYQTSLFATLTVRSPSLPVTLALMATAMLVSRTHLHCHLEVMAAGWCLDFGGPRGRIPTNSESFCGATLTTHDERGTRINVVSYGLFEMAARVPRSHADELVT